MGKCQSLLKNIELRRELRADLRGMRSDDDVLNTIIQNYPSQTNENSNNLQLFKYESIKTVNCSFQFLRLYIINFILYEIILLKHAKM